MATLQLDSPGACFPPLQDGDETPEFLRWAIDFQCGPREQHRGANLEALFRQLRPLAALGDAQLQGRVNSSHWVFASANAIRYEFNAIEILNFYGASSSTEVPCLTCPANTVTNHFPNCIGILSRGTTTEEFISALEVAIESNPSAIPKTSPRWYGLWTDSPLQGERLKIQTQLVAAATSQLATISRSVSDLLRGLQSACELNLPFHVQLHPLGFVHSGRWKIPAHCGYCSGVRAPRQRVCNICRRENAWKSSEKRHLLGIRPYRAVKAGK